MNVSASEVIELQEAYFKGRVSEIERSYRRQIDVLEKQVDTLKLELSMQANVVKQLQQQMPGPMINVIDDEL